MKKYILILCIILSSIVFSQESLVVEYELHRNINLDNYLSSNEMEGSQVPDFLKKELENKFNEIQSYTLILSQVESSFNWIEKISNSQNNGLFSNISLGETGLIYKNLESGIYLWETSIMNKYYVVSDSLKIYDWKISKETKEILGYETRKAEAIIDSLTTIEAWYAPKLPYKNGPEYYGNLPGLILEVSETKTTDNKINSIKKFVAISVKTDKKNKITSPKKGKTISKSEYLQLKQESRAKRSKIHSGGVDKD